MAGMAFDPDRQSSLAYLVDLMVQARRDADRPEVELHRRDREFMSTGSGEEHDPRGLLEWWLDALRLSGETLPGRLVERGYRLQQVGLAVLGLLIGWGVAAAVFAYDGSQPVNVVHVLVVFVVVQLALLLLLGIVLLPPKAVRWLPGFSGLQDFLSWFSPGQVTRWAVRWLPSAVQDWARQTLAERGHRESSVGRVTRWVVVHSAQVFGVAFNAGALVTFLYLVSFSDLAFSWSTTLRQEEGRAHRVTSVVSKPWGWMLPGAVPSSELIEQTRFNRQIGFDERVASERWGQWWPFLIAAMMVYGLLPRLALLAVAAWRLRVAVRTGFMEMPGVTVILDRLTSQWVSTQATGEETDERAESRADSADWVSETALIGRELVLVNWGGLGLGDADLTQRVREVWRVQVSMVLHAGGRVSVEADSAAIEAVASLPASVGVAVLVKGWEPPVLELVDFLRDLRSAVGPSRLLIVCPAGLSDKGELTAAKERDFSQWQRRLHAEGDRAMVVRDWSQGGGQ